MRTLWHVCATVRVRRGETQRLSVHEAVTDGSVWKGDVHLLPIEPILPLLKAELARSGLVIVVAPPGAGKSTRLPLALLEGPDGLSGKIILLEPRRIAARAVAERIALALGETVGQTVGLRVRYETRVSAKTRIEVVTEGVFSRMILADPALDGVEAVLFDEFHERSLDADLGLAFALDSRRHLRDDLKLGLLSATLDSARLAEALGGWAVIESEGRSFPVDTRYLGFDPVQPLEEQMARAVRRALGFSEGSVLAFLPGQAEILRTLQRLQDQPLPENTQVWPLYGALPARDQDLALQAPAPGRRKVVLATAIAETSLTLEGVRVVVDCGLARRPSYDPATGLSRLTTERVSRASADQRRGRAGRTAPGICFRLWDEAQTRALIAADRPEILEADLAAVALQMSAWGVRDPAELILIDPPPRAAFQEARALLQRLGALSDRGDLTEHGRLLTALPLPPRLADMVVRAAAAGRAQDGAHLAAVIAERGLGGAATDLAARLGRARQEASGRSRDALAAATRWVKALPNDVANSKTPLSDAMLVAHAFPERVAQARPGTAGGFKLANGRGAQLDPADPLAKAPYLAVADVAGGTGRVDRILSALPLDLEDLKRTFASELRHEQTLDVEAGGTPRVWSRVWFGELCLEERRLEAPAKDVVGEALLAHVKGEGLAVLPWPPAAHSLRARAAFLREQGVETAPDLSDGVLLAEANIWLLPLLTEAGRLDRLRPEALAEGLRNLCGWTGLQLLDRLAPDTFQPPAGGLVPIDYSAEGGPRAEVRVQALFGLGVHPTVLAGRMPLTLALTSPAHRPIQVTNDLVGFWRGSWKAVRTDMKGRYPKHPWPEDPMMAEPTVRAKPRRPD